MAGEGGVERKRRSRVKRRREERAGKIVSKGREGREGGKVDVPTLLARTSSTSDAVEVDVDRAGHLVVDNVLDTLDVESVVSNTLLNQLPFSRAKGRREKEEENSPTHPRLAKSVASKNPISPSLNFFKLANLCSCVKSPCNSSLLSNPCP